MENFKILNEKENSLFSRKEIQVSVEAEITPSHLNVEKLISEKFSTPAGNIKIKKISGKFGSKTFTITANIYASKEDKNNIEPAKKKEGIESEKEKNAAGAEGSIKKIESQEKSANNDSNQPSENEPEEKSVQ